MKLLIINHKYQYEMLKLCQIFLPNEKIQILLSRTEPENEEPVKLTELTDEKIIVSFCSPEKSRTEFAARKDKSG